MAQMSVYDDELKIRHSFIVCIVECKVNFKKEYDIIISPINGYTEISIRKLIQNILYFLHFLRIIKKKIRVFIRKDNDAIFEIEYTYEPYILEIKKYLETYDSLKTGILEVYKILKDKPRVEVFKIKDVLKLK
jgi:hypothetical protein